MGAARFLFDLLNLDLFVELYGSLRRQPEDWDLDKYHADDAAIKTRLDTSFSWMGFTIKGDARSIPFSWRPLLYSAFQRGQRDLLAKKINALLRRTA